MNSNFFWVTVQRPPVGENHVQLAYGVDQIGPDAVITPRLFGASHWKAAFSKAVELAKVLNLQVCLNVPGELQEEIENAFKLVYVKILNESEE